MADGENLIEFNVSIRITLSLCSPTRVLLSGNSQTLATMPKRDQRGSEHEKNGKEFYQTREPLTFQQMRSIRETNANR